jgi:hypothetical protein
MKMWYTKQLLLLAGFIFGIFCIAIVLAAFGGLKGTVLEDHPTITEPTIVQEGQTQKDYFTYKGQDGKRALELLYASKAWVEVDSSGLITAINFRKADPKKKEYWSFYVNKKLASVGPAEYITKSSDVIEWKIEKY